MLRELSGTYNDEAPVPDYLEATVFSKEEAVIMVGNFADINTREEVLTSLSKSYVTVPFTIAIWVKTLICF